jgi:cardiolipin synthase
LLRRYVRALARATHQVLLAHAYFLPNRRVIRALTSAARRGVRVVLLLPGASDVPFARAASRRLYRKFLASGVEVYEWNRSVLHAKAAAIDGRIFLVGSFNLDPLSLANLEALVEVRDPQAVREGEQWIQAKLAGALRVGADALARPALQQWAADVVGLWAARLAEWVARLLSHAGRPRGWRKKSRRRNP